MVNGRSSSQFVAFEQRLRELASATGQDLTIDFTVLDGDAERFAAAMQEQVQRGVDVLLAPGQEVALKAARAATQRIPIVMVAIDYDPVALGYVQSLARPGGNITGVYLDTIELAAKRAQLLKEAAPAPLGSSSFGTRSGAADALQASRQSDDGQGPGLDAPTPDPVPGGRGYRIGAGASGSVSLKGRFPPPISELRYLCN